MNLNLGWLKGTAFLINAWTLQCTEEQREEGLRAWGTRGWEMLGDAAAAPQQWCSGCNTGSAGPQQRARSYEDPLSCPYIHTYTYIYREIFLLQLCLYYNLFKQPKYVLCVYIYIYITGMFNVYCSIFTGIWKYTPGSICSAAGTEGIKATQNILESTCKHLSNHSCRLDIGLLDKTTLILSNIK